MNIGELEEINKKVDEIMLRVEETENEFIFQSIKPYLEKITEKRLSKKELNKYLLLGMSIKGSINQLEEEQEWSYANFEDYIEQCASYMDAEYDDFFHMGLRRAIDVLKKAVEETEKEEVTQ